MDAGSLYHLLYFCTRLKIFMYVKELRKKEKAPYWQQRSFPPSPSSPSSGLALSLFASHFPPLGLSFLLFKTIKLAHMLFKTPSCFDAVRDSTGLLCCRCFCFSWRYDAHATSFAILRCTRLCNHLHQLIIERVHHPKKEPDTGWQSPSVLLPHTLASTNL